MDAVRLRVVFADRHILSKSQKSEELKRSWLLLKPQHETIADLSSYLTHIFDLHHSCPNGISLSMDGFMLPPFESASILKDKDLIRVKRKDGTSGETVELSNGANLTVGEEIVEKKPVDTGVLLLANEEFEKETSTYQSELEEKEDNLVGSLLVDNSAGKDAGSKKKKASKGIRSPNVKREGGTSIKTVEVGNEANLTGGEEFVDTGVIVLEIEECEKETGGYRSECYEKEDSLVEDLLLVENSAVTDVGSKKRIALNELKIPKKKKRRTGVHQDIETDFQAEQNVPCHSSGLPLGKNVNGTEKASDITSEHERASASRSADAKVDFIELLPSPKRKKKKRSVVHQDIETDFQSEQNEPCYNSGLSFRMDVDNKEKVSDIESIHERATAPRSAEGNGDLVVPLPSPKRFSTPFENGTGSVDVPHTSEGTKKISRSARRIKAKRQWRKELKAEAKELLAENFLLLIGQSPEKDMLRGSRECQQHNQTDEADDDFAPIVIRPGHIRFEPLEKDPAVQQSRVVVETFQSVGITNKRKGRRLGDDKIVYCTRSKCRDSNGECMQMMTMEKVKPQNDPIVFNKLPLLTSCPKEGDVIAYRVLESLSTSTPVLSSFRVGKTLCVDHWAKTLLLTPIEEYPIASEKSDKDAWDHQPDNSINRECGYLEIDLSTLFDVRIVKLAPFPGKDVNVWDALSQAASAKNALLIRKKEWGKASSTTSSWKKEWGKASSTTSSWKKEWSNASSTASSWKKEWSNASTTTNSWSCKPLKKSRRSQNCFAKSKGDIRRKFI